MQVPLDPCFSQAQQKEPQNFICCVNFRIDRKGSLANHLPISVAAPHSHCVRIFKVKVWYISQDWMASLVFSNKYVRAILQKWKYFSEVASIWLVVFQIFYVKKVAKNQSVDKIFNKLLDGKNNSCSPNQNTLYIYVLHELQHWNSVMATRWVIKGSEIQTKVWMPPQKDSHNGPFTQTSEQKGKTVGLTV